MPRKPYNLKPMANSWDAALTDPQRWAVYAKFVEFRSDWTQVSGWVREEYGIKEPSRSGLYRFADRMRRLESAHRLEQAIIARSEAGELARSAGQTDADLVAAYETLAADAALGMGDAKKAGLYTKMAMAIGEKIATREALAIKRRAQDTKEESLRLARAKFEAAESRLQTVRDALAAPKTADGGLSPETLKKIEEAAGLL